MKAIRVHELGDPEVMRLEEVPDLHPAAGQVLVSVRAVGVNPVDTYIRAGIYPIKKQMPYIPGLDAAGIVEAVGEGVKHVKPGARVYVAGSRSGTYAEQTLCDESHVHPLPAHATFGQGASIGVPYGAAYYGLFFRAMAKPGEFVLVHGASGGVGTAAIQIARAAGMTVLGTAGTDEGRNLVLQQGAHHVLDHRTDGYLHEVPAMTCEHGVDVVLEMLANVNLGKDLKILAKNGRIVVIGSRGSAQIDPRDAMSCNGSILGMSLFNASRDENAGMHAAFFAGLDNGTLRPVVGKEFPLKEAAAAHRAIMEAGAYGKIILVP